jgi:hypothetical protein
MVKGYDDTGDWVQVQRVETATKGGRCVADKYYHDHSLQLQPSTVRMAYAG